MKALRGSVFFLILSICFVPNICGMESEGGSLASVGSNAEIAGNSIINDAGLSEEVSSNGVASFDEVHRVLDETGKEAQVTASVINGLDISYSASCLPQEVLPGDDPVPGSSMVSAKETLFVSQADSACVTAHANNARGNVADVRTTITNGGLSYSNFAMADQYGASASQGGSSTAEGISFNWGALNGRGEQVTGGTTLTRTTSIDKGTIDYYFNSAKSGGSLDTASANSVLQAHGESIFISGGAANSEGNRVAIGLEATASPGTTVDIFYSDDQYADWISVDAYKNFEAKGTLFDIWNGWGASDQWFDWIPPDPTSVQGAALDGRAQAIGSTHMEFEMIQSVKEDTPVASVSVDTDGSDIFSSLRAFNAGEDLVHTDLNVQSGSLAGYNGKIVTHDEDASAEHLFDYASGQHIYVIADAGNKEGDKISSVIDITDGSIQPSSSLGSLDSAWAMTTGVATNLNVDGVTFSEMRTNSLAENKKPAYEYETNIFRQKKMHIYDYGSEEFEVRNIPTNIHSVSTTDGVSIIAELPDNTPKAVLLEPFQKLINPDSQYDLRNTVFQRLVDKGYATTRYTDSAVSTSMIQQMDDFNIAVVVGHMDPTAIGLSCDPGCVVYASQLEYTHPPEDSFVILAGCVES